MLRARSRSYPRLINIVILAAVAFLVARDLTRRTPAPAPAPESPIRPPSTPGTPHIVPANGLPKLVLQITVDQLRGDLPFRYRDRFVSGGFRLLMDRGTWYDFVHHAHSKTETVVGHATLATGAYPSHHGLIADAWYDRETGKLRDCVEDPQYPTVGTDPSGATTPGASPRALLSSTFADELLKATGGKARVFAVSGKNRGAVPLAGHAGKAFWFDTGTGRFVSSRYYYGTDASPLPQWVTRWNEQHHADRFENLPWSWDLSHGRATYLYSDITNQFAAQTPPERTMATLDAAGFRRNFPHRFDDPRLRQAGFYYAALTMSPYADLLTLDFAKGLIVEEQLGSDNTPDYLAISLSSTDIIAHWFGPTSLESEDNLLRLDRALADLFTFVDRRIGLENTLIVLAGDHGGPYFPEYLAARGGNTGRLIIAVDALKNALEQKYGSGSGKYLLAVEYPNVYLDNAVIRDAGREPADVGQFLAETLMEMKGVQFAVYAGKLPAEAPPAAGHILAYPNPNPRLKSEASTLYLVQGLAGQIRRNQHPGRSGDVYIVAERNWQVRQRVTADQGLVAENTSPNGANDGLELLQHGEPWPYDSYVPVAFGGAGVRVARIFRKIFTVDVAATLASYLKTGRPSDCVGTPLAEVLESFSPTSESMQPPSGSGGR